MKLRRCTENEADAVRAFVAKCPPLTVHTPYTYWTTLRYFGEGCFVIEHDEEIVGYISGVPSTALPDVVFVWQVGVAQEWQGKGLSTRLLDAVANVAIDKGLTRMQYSVGPSNLASRRTFERFATRRGAHVERIGVVKLAERGEQDELYEMELA